MAFSCSHWPGGRGEGAWLCAENSMCNWSLVTDCVTANEIKDEMNWCFISSNSFITIRDKPSKLGTLKNECQIGTVPPK